MRALLPPLLGVLALAPLGCRVDSPPAGTMRSRDVVITAEIERLGEGDQFRTDVTIARVLPDGSTASIAAPSVISHAGERAEVRIDDEETRLTTIVHVPAPDDRHETVRVQVTIEEPESLRSPRMLLDVPALPAPPPEPESHPADVAMRAR